MLDALIKIHGSRLAVVNLKEVFTKLFTDLPAELSFPLRYFEHQCEEDSKLREYVKVLEVVRTELFEIRDFYQRNEVGEFLNKLDDYVKALQDIREQMFFFAACMPEEHRWICSCSLQKRPGGILYNSFFYDLDGWIYFLKELNKEYRQVKLIQDETGFIAEVQNA